MGETLTSARWWSGQARERYWLEATNRHDLGTDLRAPLHDDSGQPNWRYGLFREALAGDVVFHYDSKRSAITAVSTIAGPAQNRPIVWAARGSYARQRGAEPRELDGYFMPLAEHRVLPTPLSLERLRGEKDRIASLVSELRERVMGPLYFPFELSERPVRLLQGYAFKLPADFVAAFDELSIAVAPGDDAGGEPAHADQAAQLRSLISAIEAVAPAYAVGGLQALRKELKGLKRVPSQSLFASATVMPNYAFHNGGRTELQFNIGFDVFADGSEALRAGAGFSFERSMALRSIDVLVPKVARFNDFVRQHADSLGDLRMWHFAGDRSPDYAPRPIQADLVREGVFIFLGGRMSAVSPNPHLCLRLLDRLLPLYRHVEADAGAADAQIQPDSVLAPAALVLIDRLGDTPLLSTTATYRERQLDVTYRHREIQLGLRDRLRREFPGAPIGTEVFVGEKLIDLVLETNEGLWFYEVKTAATARSCLREAIGQLLEYALWPTGPTPSRLIVVGEPPLDRAGAAYLGRLNERFPIPLSYQALPLGGA